MTLPKKDPFAEAEPREGRPLTQKMITMIHEYVRTGGDCAKAWMAAYPGRKVIDNSKLRAKIEALLQQPRFEKELLRLREKIAAARSAKAEEENRLVADVVDVMESAARALKVDPASIYDASGNVMPITQWPENTRLAVDGIEYDRETGVMKSVKFTPRSVARDQLAKHLGWYERDNRQKHPHKGLTDEELDAKLQEAIRLARIEAPHLEIPEFTLSPTPPEPTQH